MIKSQYVTNILW